MFNPTALLPSEGRQRGQSIVSEGLNLPRIFKAGFCPLASGLHRVQSDQRTQCQGFLPAEGICAAAVKVSSRTGSVHLRFIELLLL
jgi:hypothetical protein